MKDLGMQEWKIEEVVELQEEKRLPWPSSTVALLQDVAPVCSQSPQEKDYPCSSEKCWQQWILLEDHKQQSGHVLGNLFPLGLTRSQVSLAEVQCPGLVPR